MGVLRVFLLFITIGVWSSSALACGLEGQPKRSAEVESFYLGDKAEAHLILAHPGCPESTPLRISVAVVCGNPKKLTDDNFDHLLDGIGACSIEKYSWNPKKESLTLKWKAPTLTKSGFKCDQLKSETIFIGSHCLNRKVASDE